MRHHVNAAMERTRAAFDKAKAFGRCFGQCMIGVPDYDTYVAHVKKTHPEQEPMSWDAFFRNRQDARYGGSTKGFRCC